MATLTLLTGPPGSGKTETVLRRLREAAAGGASDVTLVTPTATMAEHVRNRLAREGWVFSPRLAQTLSKFVGDRSPGLTPASPAILQRVVDHVLERTPWEPFREVAGFRGFRNAVRHLFEELSLTGRGETELEELFARAGLKEPTHQAFLALYRQVEEELDRLKLTTRAAQLRQAAAAIRKQGAGGLRTVLFDGFSSFSDLELDLLSALRQAADVLVTLPVSAGGADSTRERLMAMGAREQSLDRLRPELEETVFYATSDTQEAEEIARRILMERSQGRLFRHIGVIVRSETPFVALLRTTFHRFGIPARFYFASALHSHPVVRFLGGVIGALLSGWDHSRMLEALRAAAGADPDFDRWEHQVREQLDGRGLEALRALPSTPKLAERLERFALLEEWLAAPAAPKVWKERFSDLAALFVPTGLAGPFSPESIEVWRSQAEALRQFGRAVAEAAAGLGDESLVDLRTFWREAEAVLRLAEFRVPDHRRDVVHVMDAVEARQWKLPCVFLCHLLEGEFPQRHAEHPLLGDAARERLNALGLRLRTRAEIQADERFLFVAAKSCATGRLVLSYPKYNEKGEENLRSFFLTKEETKLERAVRCRPARVRPAATIPSLPAIPSPEAVERIVRRHRSFSPTALETFLRCPYEYFHLYTLALADAPADPEDRLTPALAGNIVHRAIGMWHRDGGEICAIADRLLDRVVRENRIPPGCRVENERLRIHRALRRYAQDPRQLPGWSSQFEWDIAFQAREDVRIAGRIDRLDVSPWGEALVVEFKYRGESGKREIRDAYEQGYGLQACLYLLAVADKWKPAGMFYWCLRARKQPIWGRHTGIAGWDAGEAVPAAELVGMLEEARKRSLEAADRIRAGDIRPQPQPAECERCACFDVCRSRTTVVRRAAAGGEP